MAKRSEEASAQLIDLDQVTNNVGDFYEKYKNILLGVIGGIAVLTIGYWAYNNFYVAPNQKEAVSQMARAQRLFERDSFAAALSNPGGGFPGFADVAKKYSGTPAGNLANYYAGVCLLNTGKPADAAKYLESFDPEGSLLTIMKSNLLGDAYADQNQLDKAISQYKKASSTDNEALTPMILMKVGMLSEKMGKKADAKEAYQKVKDDYGNTSFGRQVEKYLSRVSE